MRQPKLNFCAFYSHKESIYAIDSIIIMVYIYNRSWGAGRGQDQDFKGKSETVTEIGSSYVMRIKIHTSTS